MMRGIVPDTPESPSNPTAWKLPILSTLHLDGTRGNVDLLPDEIRQLIRPDLLKEDLPEVESCEDTPSSPRHLPTSPLHARPANAEAPPVTGKYKGITRTGRHVVQKCSRTARHVVQKCSRRTLAQEPPKSARAQARTADVGEPEQPQPPQQPKPSNFRQWRHSKKVPFDKFPLLSALCDSETARDESTSTYWFLPLRCFTQDSAADPLRLQQKHMERVQEKRHGGEVANSGDSKLFASLWGNASTDIPLARIIPTLFWIGHTERYSAAQKFLTAAFDTKLRLENLLLLLNLGNAVDSRTQVELGFVIEHLAKLKGERVVEFFQRKYQHWFQQLDPTKGQVSVLAVGGMLSSFCPEHMHTKNDVTRKKIVRLIQRLFQLGVVRDPSGKCKTRSFEPSRVMLSLVDFACILSRAILAQALDKVRRKVHACDSGLRVELKCAAIQREIVVSLLLNKAFWGEKESKSVMTGLLELFGDVTPDDLAAFQKVKAQGMRTIHPLECGVT